MHLVQVLLPLHDNDGNAFDQSVYRDIAADLAEHFGGLTAYARSPAVGLWKPDAGPTARDEIIVYEVMAASIDADWWRAYRGRLERLFRQDAIVVRAHAVEVL